MSIPLASNAPVSIPSVSIPQVSTHPEPDVPEATTQLESIVALVLDVAPESLDDASGRATVDGWDSLAHLNVIAAIEETFDMLFSSAEMRELTTIGRLRAALAARGSSE